MIWFQFYFMNHSDLRVAIHDGQTASNGNVGLRRMMRPYGYTAIKQADFNRDK